MYAVKHLQEYKIFIPNPPTWRFRWEFPSLVGLGCPHRPHPPHTHLLVAAAASFVAFFLLFLVILFLLLLLGDDVVNPSQVVLGEDKIQEPPHQNQG